MTAKSANFPTTPWAPATSFRSGQAANKAPDANDWDDIMAEIIAVETELYPVASDVVLWVAPHGKATGNGSLVNPYASIALAYAAVDADDTMICVMPGTYTHAATLAITGTYTGVKIIGIGGSDITILDHTTADDAAISITPAIATAFAVTIQGISVLQYAAKIGISIVDTGQTVNTITVNLKDVKLTMDTSGDSLDLVHAVDIGVLLNFEDCVFTGLTDLDVASTSDVYTVRRGVLANLATSVTDKVMAINLFYVTLTAVTGGHASQVCSALHCAADDLTLFVEADVATQTGTAALPAS